MLFGFVACPHSGYAQYHKEYWIAGGFPGSSADGAPATNARFMPWSLTTDASGNIYFVDSATRIKKIDRVSGLVTRLAGSNTLSHSGDGGLAVAANVNAKGRICTDPAGNVYFTDADHRIRKINTATGIITTVAGTTIGYSGDGGPATAAALHHPYGICTDAAGNIFVCANSALRRIDAATGIITTIASGFEAVGVCVDNAGYAYVSGNNRIRKINIVTGATTIFAGTGSTPSSGDGGPATAAGISLPHDMVINPATGKFYVICHLGSHIREIDLATGIIRTVSGDIGSCSGGWGAVMFFYLTSDPQGNLLFSQIEYNSIWKSVPFGNSSMSATYTQACEVVTCNIAVDTFVTGMSVKSYFGDGTFTFAPLAATSSCVNGTAEITHTYQAPGVYTVKHVLLSGATPVDSFVSNYTHSQCNITMFKFYNDANNDCIKNNDEHFLYSTVAIKVDSNGIAIDTINTTSGAYYEKKGPLGTVYQYTLLPGPTFVSCMPAGALIDTVTSASFSTISFGMNCPAGSYFDIGVYGTAVCGRHLSAASVLVTNQGCFASPVTVNVSNTRYESAGPVSGPAIGVATGSYNVSWNTVLLNGMSVAPLFAVHASQVPHLSLGDVVQFTVDVAPTAGDVDITNNMVIIVDTVVASFDPNIIAVNKHCYDDDGTQLQYTVHFENMGNDTAYNIHVMDTLSGDLDPKSLEIVATSAEMFTYQYKAGPHNIIKFDFPNIKLLDSAWHGLNEGMFVYNIRTKTGLPAGTATNARVGIYFDDNEVVLTNTAATLKGCPLSVSPVALAHHIALFPNPTTDELTIRTPSNTFTTLSITNTIGQQVLSQPMPQPQVKVSVSNLPAGVYYVTLKGEHGSEVRKFVKW